MPPSGIAATPLAGPLTGSAFLCRPKVYAPSSQTPLTVNTTTMAAFSSGNVCTNSFVAPPSGCVVVEAWFVLDPSAGGAKYGFGLAALGAVTPLVCPAVTPAIPSGGNTPPFVVKFYVTGLTPGTSYQFDLLGCAASGDSMTIYAYGQSSTSLGASVGAPVIMTVQAA